MLGTEFADDIVITKDGIYGAGLTVRLSDRRDHGSRWAEGDDTFFVHSTAFGVAYRVIGGLGGSDTINVTGDIVEDIVVRELEGISGYVNHLVSSPTDVGYDGLPTDGIETNVVRGDVGLVIIEETDGFTAVREGGPVQVDAYSIRLAKIPTANVYVTISAAFAPQEEADNAASANLANIAQNLATGRADTVWLCTGAAAGDCDDPTEFRRYVYVNGVLTVGRQPGPGAHLHRRRLRDPAVGVRVRRRRVRRQRPRHPQQRSRPPLRGRPGDVLQHTVLSADDLDDGLAVRNVEVQIRDNDTPGVYVTEVEPGHEHRGRPHPGHRGQERPGRRRRLHRSRRRDPGPAGHGSGRRRHHRDLAQPRPGQRRSDQPVLRRPPLERRHPDDQLHRWAAGELGRPGPVRRCPRARTTTKQQANKKKTCASPIAPAGSRPNAAWPRANPPAGAASCRPSCPCRPRPAVRAATAARASKSSRPTEWRQTLRTQPPVLGRAVAEGCADLHDCAPAHLQPQSARRVRETGLSERARRLRASRCSTSRPISPRRRLRSCSATTAPTSSRSSSRARAIPTAR